MVQHGVILDSVEVFVLKLTLAGGIPLRQHQRSPPPWLVLAAVEGTSEVTPLALVFFCSVVSTWHNVCQIWHNFEASGMEKRHLA